MRAGAGMQLERLQKNLSTARDPSNRVMSKAIPKFGPYFEPVKQSEGPKIQDA